MKTPGISTRLGAPDLIGSNETPVWVHGRNCVYRDSSVAEYRVSIRTPTGWKSYGHFHDLETATYVANIAILVEGCQKRYELNKNIGTKDGDELKKWRSQSKNLNLERSAREKYKQLLAELEASKENERLLAEKQLEVIAAENRLQVKNLASENRLRANRIAAENRLRAKKIADGDRYFAERVKSILGLNNEALRRFQCDFLMGFENTARISPQRS